LLQLINKNTNILKYINGKIIIYDYRQFFQEYNFAPHNYIDYLSLLGDKVDNIEGIKGIGPVGARNLIQQFRVVENLYQFYSTLTELNSQIFYSKLTPNVPENFKKLLEGQAELTLRNKKIISLEKNVLLPAEKFEKYDFN
jgi:5'-3' exonuclease